VYVFDGEVVVCLVDDLVGRRVGRSGRDIVLAFVLKLNVIFCLAGFMLCPV
jgi:hypothetical protein